MIDQSSTSSSSGSFGMPFLGHVLHSIGVAAIRAGTWSREAKIQKLVDLIIRDKFESPDYEIAFDGLRELDRVVSCARGSILNWPQTPFIPSENLNNVLSRFAPLESQEIDACLMSIYRDVPPPYVIALAAAHFVLPTESTRNLPYLILNDRFGTNLQIFILACRSMMPTDAPVTREAMFQAADEIARHYASGLVFAQATDAENPAVARSMAVHKANLAKKAESLIRIKEPPSGSDKESE